MFKILEAFRDAHGYYWRYYVLLLGIRLGLDIRGWRYFALWIGNSRIWIDYGIGHGSRPSWLDRQWVIAFAINGGGYQGNPEGWLARNCAPKTGEWGDWMLPTRPFQYGITRTGNKMPSVRS